MTTRKNKPAPATAAPAADGAAMGATVLEFVNTATSGNPWAPPMVDNSRANVQPELPAFNPNVGTSTHLPTAPTGEAVAPIGNTEAYRQGVAMFAADCVTRDLILWCRDAKIAPRAQAEGEAEIEIEGLLDRLTDGLAEGLFEALIEGL